jgi:hypothetical protein
MAILQCRKSCAESIWHHQAADADCDPQAISVRNPTYGLLQTIRASTASKFRQLIESGENAHIARTDPLFDAEIADLDLRFQPPSRWT